MEMPKNYNDTKEYGEFTPLALGGHICKITGVKEQTSKNGKEMIAIGLDIAEGVQKDYYKQQFDADTRAEKKWGCVVYTLVLDNEGVTNRAFKSFITAVENSNNGFKIVWGENFCKSLQGKLIGGVFGREEYMNGKGEKKFTTKCVQFRSTDAIKKGVDVPADKLLAPSTMNGFTPVDSTEDLPF